MSQAPAPRARQRKMLIGLALLFFAPLFTAFYLYYGSAHWHPLSHVNRGDLITPARPLPQGSLLLAHAPGAGSAPDRTKPNFLLGKWTLLYWGDGSCATRCRTNLYNSRQVRLALNRDLDRVQRVFVARGPCCDWNYLGTEHADLVVIEEDASTQPLLAEIPRLAGIDPAAADRIYLIDPLGNLMMSYAPDAKPKGMLEDLKRLLGLSHVG